jgi:hypothetical protein
MFLSRIRISKYFFPDPDPGSRSRIQIPDPGGKKTPDPRSRILLYIKRGMTNRSNSFLAPYGFRSKFYE